MRMLLRGSEQKMEKGVDQQRVEQPLSALYLLDNSSHQAKDTAITNPSPTTSESAVASSSVSRSSLGEMSRRASEADKKSIGPANVIKFTGPLSSFFSASGNNKVGSSFPLEPQTINSNGLNNNNHPQQRQQHQLAPIQIQLATQLGLPVGVRKVRDSGSLLLMLIFLGFLGYVIWDVVFVKEADINLIVHGHDSWGNICGRPNKPLSLVEKSGKNQTDKPFTKYTLINSQFERYTLDSARLKNGELIYVKELETSNEQSGSNGTAHQHSETDQIAASTAQIYYDFRPQTGPKSFKSPNAGTIRKEASAETSLLRNRNGTGSKVEAGPPTRPGRRPVDASAPRARRDATAAAAAAATTNATTTTYAASPLAGVVATARGGEGERAAAARRVGALLSSELVRKNPALLTNLKSNLMYQYPPMYGYRPPPSLLPSLPQGADTKAASGTAAVSSPSGPSVPSLPPLHLPSSLNNQATQQQGAENQQRNAPQANGLSALAVGRQLGNGASGVASNSYGNGDARPIKFQGTEKIEIATQEPFTQVATDLSSWQRQKFISDQQRRDATAAAAATTGGDIQRLNGNDSFDRYDHVLVNPSLLNPQQSPFDLANGGRRQGWGPVLPANGPTRPTSEVAATTSQLFYLTECVASCPADYVELIFYRCMPNNWRFSLFPSAINVTRTFIDDIVTDISHCYRELVYTFSLALVLSLGLLILLRFLASIIIWSCLLLLISLFLSMASYSWITYYYQILDLNQMAPHEPLYANTLATSDKWLLGSILLTFLAFATIATVIFMRKRILLVTMLFRESGKAIADMPLLLLQPLLTFAVLTALTFAWGFGLICLQSMKVPSVELHTGFVAFKAETLYKIMKWYHIFAFLWVSHFAIACQHYVIGASVSKWYFSTNRYNLGSPIGTSIAELFLYYLGSVALGSFLVAIFKVIRVITRQIQFLLQRNCVGAPTQPHNGGGASGGGGAINHDAAMPAAIGSSMCGSVSYVWRLFIWFFDNIVMIINRDAYVEIAIHGHSFLNGARRAFTVLASNPLRLLAIKSVSNILLAIAKVCVVFGTVSVAFVLLEEKNHQLNYSWSPIVVSAIYAYVVAHWFLSVYEMVIDALFICYCEDYELSKSREASAQLNGTTFMTQILRTNQVYR